jgi:predicted acetyltransferase
MFGRSADWWEIQLISDPEWRRRGRGEMQRAVLELDAEPAGYARYRMNPAFEYGSSTGVLEVIEALGTVPQAVAEIWRFLLDVDWMERVKSALLPIDHPLFLLLAEPRRMRFTVSDAPWVRLVDVEAALAARSYRGAEAVVLDVRDEFCPWNAGRWRVSADGVAKVDAPAALALDVSAVGSVYLGGFTFAELSRAGKLEELVDGRACGRAVPQGPGAPVPRDLLGFRGCGGRSGGSLPCSCSRRLRRRTSATRFSSHSSGRRREP